MKQNIKLVNFIDLSLEEKKMILSWRNDENIKKWMYNTSDIKLEDHLTFIESLVKTKEKLYFLVLKDDEYIGIIDFNNINDKSVDMGIYTNPGIKGVGRVLLEMIIDYAFNNLNVKKIFAEVFSQNSKAYNLYKEYSFVDVNKKIINDKEVNCLELTKNENR